MSKKLFEIICAKDENKAQEASKELINKADLNEFKSLCEKSDYLFDFVRENVYKRLSSAINKENYKNILKFFDFYSSYYDDFFAHTLAKYANEDLTDEILEILSAGNDSQKAYAAAYFKVIPDTVAVDDLRKNLNTDFDPLFVNCSAALGKMKDEESYQKYLALLKSEDDFVKLKAVDFLTSYGNTEAVEDLFITMETSAMSENIAGEITSLISPVELLSQNFQKGIILADNLVNGLGEILPLENIFNYEIYGIADYLINNSNIPEAAPVLFNMKNKFDILTQNEEYTFDLDRDTKNEIIEIKKLLFSKDNDFWHREKLLLETLFNADTPLLHTILEVIKDNNFKEFIPKLISLTNKENETIKYETIAVIKELGGLQNIDKSAVKFENPNLKASFEQMFL